MGGLGGIFSLSLTAMFNPTLLAAVTLMLVLPDTKRLMLGYLLGAYLTSISLGMLIVFSLHGTSGINLARKTLSPAEDLVFGTLALCVGLVLRSGRGERRGERRRQRKREKGEGWPERLLSRGSPQVAFAVGAALTLPGVSYLLALNRMARLEADPFPTALLVVAFCLIQQLFLEVPLIGYAVAPQRTQSAVERFKGVLVSHGRSAAAAVAIAAGLLLILRGLIELLG